MTTPPYSRATRTVGHVRSFDSRTPYVELDRQHRFLRARLKALEETALREGPIDEKQLLQQVEEARSTLALHFDFEERLGALSLMFTVYPALQTEIRRLWNEHARFLATLDSVAAVLRSGTNKAHIPGTLRSLLDELLDHELIEHQLRRASLLGS